MKNLRFAPSLVTYFVVGTFALMSAGVGAANLVNGLESGTAVVGSQTDALDGKVIGDMTGGPFIY